MSLFTDWHPTVKVSLTFPLLDSADFENKIEMTESENKNATLHTQAEWRNENTDKFNNSDKSRYFFRMDNFKKLTPNKLILVNEHLLLNLIPGKVVLL